MTKLQLSQALHPSRNRQSKVLLGNGLRIIVAFQRIQQIGPDENVKISVRAVLGQTAVLPLDIEGCNLCPWDVSTWRGRGRKRQVPTEIFRC